MKQKIINMLLYAGLTKEEFARVREEMEENNRRNMVVFSLLMAGAMLIMVLCSTFDSSLIKNIPAYLSSAGIAIVLFVLSNTVSKHSSVCGYMCMHVLMCTLYAFGIDLGTFVEPNEVTASYAILLFAVPLLFNDRPVTLAGISALSMVAYFICAAMTQDSVMFSYNRSNILPYGILSMIVSGYMMNIKLQRLSLNVENRYLSNNDQLTGLLNRRSYENTISGICGTQEDSLLCAFDVNGLKAVNDTLGHTAGDELICAAAQVITKVYGPYGSCYRIGGDEFVAILRGDFPAPEELTAELDRQSAAWQGTYTKGFSVSVGYCPAGGGKNVQDIVSEADRRMYAAKQNYYRQKGHDRRQNREQ